MHPKFAILDKDGKVLTYMFQVDEKKAMEEAIAIFPNAATAKKASDLESKPKKELKKLKD